jgi:hypothetical protein
MADALIGITVRITMATAVATLNGMRRHAIERMIEGLKAISSVATVGVVPATRPLLAIDAMHELSRPQTLQAMAGQMNFKWRSLD